MSNPSQHEIETFSGIYVDTHDPQPETIKLEDIAHALANTCRYGGHCRQFYSVAEHAVLCVRYAQLREYGASEQLAVLHHDDSEAYLGDIPRPLKPLLGEKYKHLTKRMDKAIVAAFEFPFKVDALHADEVKEADNWALLSEARELLPSQGNGWSAQQDVWDVKTEATGPPPPEEWAFGLRPHAAERLFLRTHKELVKNLD